MKPFRRKHLEQRLRTAVRFAREYSRLSWRGDADEKDINQLMRDSFMRIARNAQRELTT